MTEIREGSLDRATVVRRRDELVLETHRAYEQMFPLDELGYEGARQFADARERPDSDEARAEDETRSPASMQSHQNESGSLPLTG